MDNKTFYYSYPPTEKQEIEAIKKKYQPSEEENLAKKIKALDKQAENASAVYSIVFGVFFTLVFGAGLSLCLSAKIYDIGIALGVAGLIGMGTTPFLNEKIKRIKMQKYAQKIISLCDEYLKTDNHKQNN